MRVRSVVRGVGGQADAVILRRSTASAQAGATAVRLHGGCAADPRLRGGASRSRILSSSLAVEETGNGTGRWREPCAARVLLLAWLGRHAPAWR